MSEILFMCDLVGMPGGVMGVVERFQTAIVGICGFIGVIWTINASARHSREDREHASNLVETDRKRDLEAIRQLFLVELKMLKSMYENHIVSISERSPTQMINVPASVQNEAYKQQFEKISLLGGEEATALLQAYGLVADLPVRLRLLEKQRTNPTNCLEGYIVIQDQGHIELTKAMIESFLQKIDEAIEILERNLSE